MLKIVCWFNKLFLWILAKIRPRVKFSISKFKISEAFDVELEENVELMNRDLEAVVSVPNKDRMLNIFWNCFCQIFRGFFQR